MKWPLFARETAFIYIVKEDCGLNELWEVIVFMANNTTFDQTQNYECVSTYIAHGNQQPIPDFPFHGFMIPNKFLVMYSYL